MWLCLFVSVLPLIWSQTTFPNGQIPISEGDSKGRTLQLFAIVQSTNGVPEKSQTVVESLAKNLLKLREGWDVDVSLAVVAGRIKTKGCYKTCSYRFQLIGFFHLPTSVDLNKLKSRFKSSTLSANFSEENHLQGLYGAVGFLKTQLQIAPGFGVFVFISDHQVSAEEWHLVVAELLHHRGDGRCYTKAYRLILSPTNPYHPLTEFSGDFLLERNGTVEMIQRIRGDLTKTSSEKCLENQPSLLSPSATTRNPSISASASTPGGADDNRRNKKTKTPFSNAVNKAKQQGGKRRMSEEEKGSAGLIVGILCAALLLVVLISLVTVLIVFGNRKSKENSAPISKSVAASPAETTAAAVPVNDSKMKMKKEEGQSGAAEKGTGTNGSKQDGTHTSLPKATPTPDSETSTDRSKSCDT